MKTLVIQTAYLGDALLCVPLLRRLKQQSTELHFLCRKGVGEIFLTHGLVDEVFEVDKKDKSQLQQRLTGLRQQSYDVLLCPHQSLRSALIARSLQAKKKVGFYRWWNAFAFDIRKERPMHLPDALRQLSLARPIDPELVDLFAPLVDSTVTYSRKTSSEWQMPVSDWASMQVLEAAPEKLVCVAPGSVWATKRWTTAGFRQVVKELADRGFAVALIGSPEERELCLQVAADTKGVEVCAGKLKLTETLSKLSRAQLLVTNDSGAMHMGAFSGTPIVSIFGPTTLEIGYRPWTDSSVVVQKDLKCRPCGIHGGKVCPIKTHDCMEQVSVTEVLQACEKFLG